MDAHPAMTRITAHSLGLFAILVAVASAVAGSVPAGGWPLALLALISGTLWLADFRSRRHRLASPLLVVFVILAAVSVGLAGGRAPAPLTVVAALVAWDLARFAARLDVAPAANEEQNTERRKLEVQHLRRLTIVAALGLALAWLAEIVPLRLPFGWAVALGILAVLGLAGLVSALVRESD